MYKQLERSFNKIYNDIFILLHEEMEKNKNIILEKSFDFSLNIIQLYKELTKNKEFILSKQLLRSWTSIWANLIESNSWQSKRDFLHKTSISLKEAQESLYRLQLLERSKLVNIDYKKHINNINEIIAILTKIIKTTKVNLATEK